uniref:Single stranded DNA binding protein 4 n=1 Tax=Geospiza parvula TaxID=87175 RepID=A0A8C3NEJ8_GEOPR
MAAGAAGRRGPRGAGPGAADSRRRAMYAKGKGSGVPSDGQAREKLALYVYEYLLHVGAQKSAQTFLSEIRWEKNITLGEPPGFLHSWWCVFWDLYCAAPDRRETCEHSSEAKAFHDYSAAAAPSPVMGNLPPGDGMAGGPVPPAFFQPFMSPRYPGGPRPPLRMPNQPPVGVPGSQPLLPNAMDPAARAQGHPGMGGPMQRMNPPRGMAGMGPQSYGSGMPQLAGRPWDAHHEHGSRWPRALAQPQRQLYCLLLLIPWELRGPSWGWWPPWYPHPAQPRRLHQLQREHVHHDEPHGTRGEPAQLPHGPRSRGAAGRDERHGAAPHERVLRLRGHGWAAKVLAQHDNERVSPAPRPPTARPPSPTTEKTKKTTKKPKKPKKPKKIH